MKIVLLRRNIPPCMVCAHYIDGSPKPSGNGVCARHASSSRSARRPGGGCGIVGLSFSMKKGLR